MSEHAHSGSVADSRSKCFTFCAKRDLEAQRDPWYEPCDHALGEYTPADIPQPTTALDQTLLVCELERRRRVRGMCCVPSCGLCFHQVFTAHFHVHSVCQCWPRREEKEGQKVRFMGGFSTKAWEENKNSLNVPPRPANNWGDMVHVQCGGKKCVETDKPGDICSNDFKLQSTASNNHITGPRPP